MYGMKDLGKWLVSMWDRLMSNASAGPHLVLRVENSRRGTVLATALEVADRGPARKKGLLGRKRLEPGQGLWIVPCESVHTFGMQFPIDLVYLDRKRRVKKVRESVPRNRISACLTAHSVLELVAGTVRATQTRPGDTLEFPAAGSGRGPGISAASREQSGAAFK